MNKMESSCIFAYQWSTDIVDDTTVIKIYGLNKKNQNTCVVVKNFTPYIYFELPDEVKWDAVKAQMLVNKIDEALKDNSPLQKKLMYKYKMYYALLDANGERKKFPFLWCNFSNQEQVRRLNYFVNKPIVVPGIGNIKLKVHETNANPVLQLTSLRKIPTAGWIAFKGKRVSKEKKQTTCTYEYTVRWNDLEDANDNSVARPYIMSYDIEVNSTVPSSMPTASRTGDKVFQISCVFGRQGTALTVSEKYLLTLKKVDYATLGDDIIVQSFVCEADLLMGFVELMQTKQPNIITGYNIFGFDIEYMLKRAVLLGIPEFRKQGFEKDKICEEKTVKWSSSAYGNQFFQFLDADGRLFVDLLPLVKRDHKLNNYKLKTVSSHFLKGQTKDPLDHHGIFKCYRLGMEGGKKGEKALAIVGKYCVQDSMLVLKLFEVLTTWVGLCEMAKVVNTPIFTLYTQGQQIKVFSQVYKRCTHENIVVEKDGYFVKESDYYAGAIVFPPKPGIYDMVIPFDFCLTGDTLVSMGNGLSKRIDTLNYTQKVLGFDKETNNIKNYENINGLQKKGMREIVKVWLEDGKSISCTPEHKIMLENGEWCEAKDLEGKYVKCGIEYTEDKKCEKEDGWSLDLDPLVLDMKTENNRNDALAFSRMLGYILSDGSIYIHTYLNKNGMTRERKCSKVYLGTSFDSQNFLEDIGRFCSKPVIGKRTQGIKGTTYCINIPQKLATAIHRGKRSTQPMKLPRFILEDECPLSIIREFIGGLFGRSGTAPHCKKKNTGEISFKWITIEKYLPDMFLVFKDIQGLLLKLGLDSSIRTHLKKYGLSSKDYEENPQYVVSLGIGIDNTPAYLENIGFRYCIHKSTRLAVLASYIRMKNKIIEQHDIKRKISLQSKKFPTPLSYLENTNNLDWFNTDETGIHCLRKKVIKIEKLHEQSEVFDIEVSAVHNFVANGVVVSNCSLYPSVIIAYNICWSTLVKEKDIADSKCHVLKWEDHIGCIAEGTNINMGQYSLKIENLCRNHSLLSLDRKGLKVSRKIQSDFFVRGEKECITLYFENDTVLTCTPDHRIYTPSGWIQAGNLSINDLVFHSYTIPEYKEVELGDFQECVKRYPHISSVLFYKLLGFLIARAFRIIWENIEFIKFSVDNKFDAKEIYTDLSFIDISGVIFKKEGSLWIFSLCNNLNFTFLEAFNILKKYKIKGEARRCLNSGLIGGASSFYISHNLSFSFGSRENITVEPPLGGITSICSDESVETIEIKVKRKNIHKLLETGVAYSIKKAMCIETLCGYLKVIAGTKENLATYFKRVGYNTYSTNILLKKKLVKVEKVGIRKVYDLEVSETHSFVANGTIVHNCEHDPSQVRMKELLNIIKNNDEKLKIHRKNRDLKENKIRKPEIVKRINELIESMKPFRNEKAELNKKKPKHVICFKREFRWLKEPKGILPNILSNLLSTRDSTKKEMKSVKGELNKMNKEDPLYYEKSTYLDVLDKRQLALKVSANSAYGIMGARKGYLPFMPGAMSVTYMGRKSIEKAANLIQKKHGGVLIYGDSVSADTPILVKYGNDSINILRIDKLTSSWEPYPQFKSEDSLLHEKEKCELSSIRVWSGEKWTSIKKVIRHKTPKKMYRIISKNGVIDVTEDHSLLDIHRNQLKPANAKVGTLLYHSFPKEFDTVLFEGENKSQTVTKETSILWGIFFRYGSLNKKWAIESTSLDILLQAKYLLDIVEPSSKVFLKQGGIFYTLEEDGTYLYKKYKCVFSDDIIVPHPILNESKEFKHLFLSPFENYFSSRNKLRMQSFYTLCITAGFNCNIHYSQNMYYLRYSDKYKKCKSIKQIFELGIQDEFVYDLETEEGVFHAGIGELIVKNTDSNYVTFPKLKDVKETWDYATKVSAEVSKEFPPPMAMAFEEKVYKLFMLLTKKKYMCINARRDGTIDDNITKKGVLLERRDNCPFMKNVYQNMIMKIFGKEAETVVLDYIIEELDKLCSGYYKVIDFVITKSIKETDDFRCKDGIDSKGKQCYKVGDYKVKELPSDTEKRREIFEKQKVSTEREYYISICPAQVQLAEKMRRRGRLVPPGTRIEYVITLGESHTAKQSHKIESLEYFQMNRDYIKLDYLYYLKQMLNPFEQILHIIYKTKTSEEFMNKQYKFRLLKQKYLEEMVSLYKCKLSIKK